MKTLSCLFFGLLVFVITLCSIFTACVFKCNENFYQVFWGSVIVIIAFLIAFSICFCKEKSKEEDMLKDKINALEKMLQQINNTDDFSMIEESTYSGKKTTKKGNGIIDGLKAYANAITEI